MVVENLPFPSKYFLKNIYIFDFSTANHKRPHLNPALFIKALQKELHSLLNGYLPYMSRIFLTR